MQEAGWADGHELALEADEIILAQLYDLGQIT